MTASGPPSGAPSGPPSEPVRPGLLDWLGVALLCGVAGLAGLLEVFLVPLYAGRVLVPVAVVLAIAGNVYLPRLSRVFVRSTAGAVLPFLVWLAVVFVIGFTTRPEGDVVLPGGGYVQWVGLGLVFGGAVAGVLAIVLGMPPPAPRRPRGLSR